VIRQVWPRSPPSHLEKAQPSMILGSTMVWQGPGPFVCPERCQRSTGGGHAAQRAQQPFCYASLSHDHSYGLVAVRRRAPPWHSRPPLRRTPTYHVPPCVTFLVGAYAFPRRLSSCIRGHRGERPHGLDPPQWSDAGVRTRRDYRTGEKAAGTSSLFSCRIGRTPAWGGHAPPLVRASSRTRARSLRSL
jgi:hypothetical protein